MESVPQKNELIALLSKLLPPVMLSIMAKIASEYKKGKKISLLSNIIIICLAGCGSIVGYWVTKIVGWTEYKMTLTIFFFGLFSDKLFEFLFSRTVANIFFNFVEDWIKENIKFIWKNLNNKK